MCAPWVAPAVIGAVVGSTISSSRRRSQPAPAPAPAPAPQPVAQSPGLFSPHLANPIERIQYRSETPLVPRAPLPERTATAPATAPLPERIAPAPVIEKPKPITYSTPRAWGQSRAGETYHSAQKAGNPSWEAANPGANPNVVQASVGKAQGQAVVGATDPSRQASTTSAAKKRSAKRRGSSALRIDLAQGGGNRNLNY